MKKALEFNKSYSNSTPEMVSKGIRPTKISSAPHIVKCISTSKLVERKCAVNQSLDLNIKNRAGVEIMLNDNPFTLQPPLFSNTSSVEDLNLTEPKWVDSEIEMDSYIDDLKIPFIEDNDVPEENNNDTICSMEHQNIISKNSKLLEELKIRNRLEENQKFVKELEQNVMKFIEENNLIHHQVVKKNLKTLTDSLIGSDDSKEKSPNASDDKKIVREGTFEIKKYSIFTENDFHQTPMISKINNIRRSMSYQDKNSKIGVEKSHNTLSTPKAAVRSRHSTVTLNTRKKENLEPSPKILKRLQYSGATPMNVQHTPNINDTRIQTPSNQKLRPKRRTMAMESGPMKAIQPISSSMLTSKPVLKRASLNPNLTTLKCTPNSTSTPVLSKDCTPIKPTSALINARIERNNLSARVHTPSKLAKLFTPKRAG